MYIPESRPRWLHARILCLAFARTEYRFFTPWYALPLYCNYTSSYFFSMGDLNAQLAECMTYGATEFEDALLPVNPTADTAALDAWIRYFEAQPPTTLRGRQLLNVRKRVVLGFGWWEFCCSQAPTGPTSSPPPLDAPTLRPPHHHRHTHALQKLLCACASRPLPRSPPPPVPSLNWSGALAPCSQSARALSQLRVLALSLCGLSEAACDALESFLALVVAPGSPELAMDCVGLEMEAAGAAAVNMRAYLSLAAAMACPLGEDEASLLAAAKDGVTALQRAVAGAGRCTSTHVAQRLQVAKALLVLRERFVARDMAGLASAVSGVAGEECGLGGCLRVRARRPLRAHVWQPCFCAHGSVCT